MRRFGSEKFLRTIESQRQKQVGYEEAAGEVLGQIWAAHQLNELILTLEEWEDIWLFFQETYAMKSEFDFMEIISESKSLQETWNKLLHILA